MARGFIWILLLCLTTLSAYAVPAKRGIFTVKQADGSELRIQLRGDERHHIVLSEDDCMLVEENGIYYFAELSTDGSIAPSKLKAENLNGRSQQAQTFVQQIDRQKLLQAADAEAQQVRAAAAVSARNKVGDSARNNAEGSARAPRRNPGLFDYSFPVKGDVKGLVVLVQYKDVKFHTGYDAADYFKRMMNERGFSDYGGTGCVEEYFEDQSMGVFRPHFDVYGPITLSKNMSYYGGNDWGGSDKNAYMMAVEACQMLDATVDFSQYDTNNDGYIDNIFVFYAGQGEATGGSSDTVWPHSWNISEATSTEYNFDGVRLDRYACSNEWESGSPDGIGTFVHEFSHVMGLPDLYATSYSSAFTPGAWNILDYGPYNNEGRTPPAYSVYERYSLDWITPTVLDSPANITLNYIGATNEGCIIKTSKENEFFLLENRQQTGWDTYIPGHGMLIWHVDYNESVWESNAVNNTASHQYVDIEEADGSQSEGSRAGDAFPGTAHKTEFTDDTKPSMKTWSGKSLGMPLTEITETDSVITFKVAGGHTFEVIKPVALPATAVTSEGFTARWQAVEEATEYLLNVTKVTYDSELQQDVCDFTGGISKMPKGWTTSSQLTYANDAYSGNIQPALRLSTADSYIATPDYSAQVVKMQFWHRGSSAPEGDSIYVYAKNNGEWTMLQAFAINNEVGGETRVVDNLPSGTVALKIEYHKSGAKGAVAIDDIVVDYYSLSATTEEVYTDLAVPAEADADGIVSTAITNLLPETVYIYNVRATDGTTFTKTSNTIYVTTDAKATAITQADLQSPITNQQCYDLHGRRVHKTDNMPHGIYIIRKGNKQFKVIL